DNVVHLSNLCTEIIEVTEAGHTAVCNLGSVNLGAFVADGIIDEARLAATVRTAIVFLDRVIDRTFYPTPAAAASNARWRPVGLGVMGLQDVLFRLGLPFDAPEVRGLSRRLQERVYFAALAASCALAERLGSHPGFSDTRAARGWLHPDGWAAATLSPDLDWPGLRQRVARHGLRNSLLVAIAPTATIASIAGCYECIEPQVSNLFKRETLSGEFLQVNHYLVDQLKQLGLWTEEVRSALKRADGSVQGLSALPEAVRRRFRTAWELPQRVLIDLAAERAPFVDQSQSLNLFIAEPSLGKLASMYRYAWERGLKSTYYLRSRPASRIAQTTVRAQPAEGATGSPAADRCSLENPDVCEACQ
ncbi:MAG: ribonucleoside-diphosphate reductase subunit alpha, partial [Candidatus Dormibacteraceae bacterium]